MQQGVRSWNRIGAVVAGSLVVVALLGACSSGDDDSSSTTTTEAGGGEPSGGESSGGGGGNPFGGGAPEGGGGPAATDPDTLTGVWEGTYMCGQGETPLRLTIDDRGDGGVGGAFEFETPDGRRPGSYSMVGNRDGGTLTLDGHEWLEEVPNYHMVGLRADLEGRSDTETLSGTVEGQGCTEFTAERTATAPWYSGTWEGQYGCTQGVTGLTLTIEPGEGNDVTAVFEFYAVEENPEVPSGSYRMAGGYTDGRLVLEGTEWIEQPPGYVMVGYESNTDLGIDPNRIFGTVQGDGCNIFEMRRQES